MTPAINSPFQNSPANSFTFSYTISPGNFRSIGDSLLNFTITIRQSAQVSLIDVAGRLTSFEASGFRDAILGLLAQNHKDLILNLTGLEYLDSSGVGELVRNYMSVVKKGGTMKVVGLAPKVEEIMKVTKLYQVFPEFPDEASALRSFPK